VPAPTPVEPTPVEPTPVEPTPEPSEPTPVEPEDEAVDSDPAPVEWTPAAAGVILMGDLLYSLTNGHVACTKWFVMWARALIQSCLRATCHTTVSWSGVIWGGS
jgi:hypothetical protein